MIDQLPMPAETPWPASLLAAARVYLWLSALAAIFVAAGMGLAMAAGPSRESGATVRLFAAGAGITLALHAGLLLAPWLAGTARWAVAAWLLAPVATLGLLAVLVSLRFAFAGGSRMMGVVVLCAGLYLLPLAALWVLRPRG